MKAIIVAVLLFLIVLPVVIAHLRRHHKKKLVILTLGGAFLLSMLFVMIPSTNDFGGWVWVGGWFAALIMSLTKPISDN